MARGRTRASNGSTTSTSELPDAAPSDFHGGPSSSGSSYPVPGPSARDTFSYHSVELAPTDALPYFDRELELQPGLRARVDALIAAEQASLPPIDPSRLPPAYEPFSTRPDFRAELERISSGQPSSHTLDTTRYTLPSPPSGPDAPLSKWQSALDSAHAQLGQMDVRLKNIELLKKYGSNHWRLSNFQSEQAIRLLSEEVEKVKGETDEVNRLRQRDQVEVGGKLGLMEKRWTELISRGLQLEVANITTRGEVEELRRKKRRLEEEIGRLE